MAAWRRKAALLGLFLHLSQARTSAYQRGNLLTGPLEETNEAYAVAKIAGLKLAQAYRAQHGFIRHLLNADQSLWAWR